MGKVTEFCGLGQEENSYLAKPAVPNLLDVAETVTDHLRASGTHCGGQNPPQKTELVCVICRYVVIHSILVPDLFVVSIFIYLTRLLHEIKCSSVLFFLSEEMQPGHEFNQFRILEQLCCQLSKHSSRILFRSDAQARICSGCIYSWQNNSSVTHYGFPGKRYRRV